jgi:hypothetical protein
MLFFKMQRYDIFPIRQKIFCHAGKTAVSVAA